MSPRDEGRRTRRRGQAEAAPAPKAMEPVEGDGPVRRIVFEDTPSYRSVVPDRSAPPPLPTPEPAPAPEPEAPAEPVEERPATPMDAVLHRRARRHYDIEEIHREVDNLRRRRYYGLPGTFRHETKTVYETPGGAVHKTRYVDEHGERRMVRLSSGEGALREERRFVSTMVDRAIGRAPPPRSRQATKAAEPAATTKPPAGGAASPVLQETGTAPRAATRTATKARRRTTKPKKAASTKKPKGSSPQKKARKVTKKAGTTTKKTASKTAKKAASKTASKAGAGKKRTAGTRKKSAKRTQNKTARKAPARKTKRPATKRSDDTQPQCAALTRDGVQCRNSSRRGSKYCSSHRTHKPRGSIARATQLDTLPRHKKARDTTPTVRRTRRPTKKR